MGAMRLSTIGYERRFNAALQHATREAFVESLTENMPPAPDRCARCSEIAASARRSIRTLPTPADAAGRVPRTGQADGRGLLSVRDYATFGGSTSPALTTSTSQ